MKGVIFDFDGTLFDTVNDVIDNLNQSLNHFGYPSMTDEEVKRFLGNGALNLIEDCIGLKATEEKVHECLEYYNHVYDNSVSPKTKPFFNIVEVLQKLRQRGYKLFVLSNKPQKTLERVLSIKLKDFVFDRVIGGDKDRKLKPDPESTLKLLEEENILPKNCYFVGDGETDVLTSINAKTNGIAVLWGYRTKEVLQNFGAKVFAKTPNDLLTLIV